MKWIYNQFLKSYFIISFICKIKKKPFYSSPFLLSVTCQVSCSFTYVSSIGNTTAQFTKHLLFQLSIDFFLSKRMFVKLSFPFQVPVSKIAKCFRSPCTHYGHGRALEIGPCGSYLHTAHQRTERVSILSVSKHTERRQLINIICLNFQQVLPLIDIHQADCLQWT